MKQKRIDWKNYWKDANDLDFLMKAQADIGNVYNEIRNSLGRILMSEEMMKIQESLDSRIEELQQAIKKSAKKAA